jgi:hypothetical protein
MLFFVICMDVPLMSSLRQLVRGNRRTPGTTSSTHEHQDATAVILLQEVSATGTPGLRREEVADLAGVGLTWDT